MKYLTLVLIFICFVSCGRNLYEARRVSKNFTREYTGLDTLIRIDGYYYHEDSTGFKLPIIFSKHSEFKIFRYGNFRTQEELQNAISRLEPCNGNYTIAGDTIKVKWADYYELWSHSIFVEYYLIVNDTTLRQIWYSCETCPDNEYDTNANYEYHFVKY